MNKKYGAVQILLSALMFFLVFATVTGYSTADEKAAITEVGKFEGWREIRIDVVDFRPVGWCGSTKKLLLTSDKNDQDKKIIKLLDIETGDIQEINTTYIPFTNPSCSYDGRYVFYTTSLLIFSASNFSRDIPDQKTFDQKTKHGNLFVYDTKTKKESLIYSVDRKRLPTLKYFYKPLSPFGEYLIGPADWKEKIRLPNGEEVKIVPIFKEGDKLTIDYHQIVWSFDSSKLFLLDSTAKTLFIHDPKSNQRIVFRLKIDGYANNIIRPSLDNTKIYIMALSPEMPISSDDNAKKIYITVKNLYVLDITKPEAKPELLIKDINDFDIGHDGTIVFSTYGHITFIPHSYVEHPKKPSAIELLDMKGGRRIIKKFSKPLRVSVSFSTDGQAILLREEDVITISILVRDGK